MTTDNDPPTMGRHSEDGRSERRKHHDRETEEERLLRKAREYVDRSSREKRREKDDRTKKDHKRMRSRSLDDERRSRKSDRKSDRNREKHREDSEEDSTNHRSRKSDRKSDRKHEKYCEDGEEDSIHHRSKKLARKSDRVYEKYHEDSKENSAHHRSRKKDRKRHHQSDDESPDGGETCHERKGDRMEKRHKEESRKHHKNESRRKDKRGGSKAPLIKKSDLYPLGNIKGSPPSEPLEVDRDYFAYHEHLWVYLYRDEGVVFGDLTSEEARQAFQRFVDRYNAGKLEVAYYDPSGLPAQAVEQCQTTRHKWSFQTSETEAKSLKFLQEGVRKQTEYIDTYNSGQPVPSKGAASSGDKVQTPNFQDDTVGITPDDKRLAEHAANRGLQDHGRTTAEVLW